MMRLDQTDTHGRWGLRSRLLREIVVVAGCTAVLAGTAYGAILALTSPEGWVAEAVSVATAEDGRLLVLSSADSR
ncbi:MAG: hypothetical protein SGJ21_01985 [Alphaproteobacteria bacterium]|nr:hypothetical protein [Alphaproteobacteria bacterium]